MTNRKTICGENDCDVCSMETTMATKWYNFLITEFSEQYFIVLKEKLHNCIEITPPIRKVFEFTHFSDIENIKVVIVGQDPYSTRNLACGVAFTASNNKIPYSLNTIFRAIKNDYKTSDLNSNSVYKWMSQGVLLLNSCLTCEISKPNSHRKIGWKQFIAIILKKLQRNGKKVFLLCGKEAHAFSDEINKEENLCLKASHPGHFTAMKFIREHNFKKINSFLKFHNIKEINW